MEDKGKVLIVCPISRDIITFRKYLIGAIKNRGYSVAVLVFDDDYRFEIEELGVDLYVVKDDNRSINPFKILSLKGKYKKIIKHIRPDIVFTFELKPNIFCVKAAASLKIKKIYSMVEGGGDVFGSTGFKWSLIRFVVCKMMKAAFKHVKKIFFINNDDKAEFISRKIIDPEKIEVIPGIGVDTDYFAYKPILNHKKFLMVSRMLKTKGVIEFCEAARIVKQKHPDAIFNYLGSEGTVKMDDISKYINSGTITYCGTAKDVRPYYEDCTVQVLPTYYREGLVLVNVEAGAIGRPTITCNTIGAKDTVKDGYNGFLVEPRNPEDLAKKMIYFIENPEAAEIMGRNNRAMAEEIFDQRNINETICRVIFEEKEESVQ